MKAAILAPLNHRRYVLSVSFSDYVYEHDGIPKVHLAHQMLCNEKDIGYVHIYPIRKMVFNSSSSLTFKYRLYIDGIFRGVYTTGELIRLINYWENNGHENVDIHIHHLMFVNLKSIKRILSMYKNSNIKIYIHDFYLMCCSYNLLDSNDEFCGCHGLNNNDCKDCKKYNRYKRRIIRIRKLLNELEDRITFVCPSQSTKDILNTCYPKFKSKTIVIPHQDFINGYKGNYDVVMDRKLKVAYLGMPATHKGWEEFKELYKRYKNNYDFYIFNSSIEKHDGINKITTGFRHNNLNAMTEALRKNKIDIVVLWAHWPETYSFTYYEAYSANCYVITNMISGNITKQVYDNKNGIILNNTNDLISLFSNNSRINDLVNNFKKSNNYGPLSFKENTDIFKEII